MNERVEKIAKALCDIFGRNDPAETFRSAPSGAPAEEWHWYVPAAEAALDVIENGAPHK